MPTPGRVDLLSAPLQGRRHGSGESGEGAGGRPFFAHEAEVDSDGLVGVKVKTGNLNELLVGVAGQAGAAG